MEVWYFITLIGESVFWLILTGVLIGLYFLTRKRLSLKTKAFAKKGMIIFIAGLWITAGVTFALKYSIPIERPCIPCTGNQEDCNPYCPDENSFPSGHSAVIFCVSTSVFLIFKKVKFLAIYLIALVVAFSRYALGVHHPADVVAGALIGIIIPIIVFGIFRKRLDLVS
jgi:membrane-associated phospholipid phosphatase